MSKLKHQKKRNTGLLYEFLIHSVSQKLVEGDKNASALAVKLIKKSFAPNTEMMKELRLFRSLLNPHVTSPTVALDVIKEVRDAAKNIDPVKLDREKSILIKNINHNLNENNSFYDPQIENYKLYATIQLLFNEWREVTPDLGNQAMFSDKLLEHLTRPVLAESVEKTEDHEPGMTRLLMKVMTQKINEKYSVALNPDQRGLVKAFAFASVHSDFSSLKKKLEEIKQRLLKNINQYQVLTESTLVKDKLEETKAQLLAENVEFLNEELVSRFMLYLKLDEELISND